jgi:hypothetical protein
VWLLEAYLRPELLYSLKRGIIKYIGSVNNIFMRVSSVLNQLYLLHSIELYNSVGCTVAYMF